MRVIGIDPGATGALVMLEDGTPIEWMEMPVVKIGSTTRVNASAVADFLQESLAWHVFVESVHSMPKQGVASSFNFGHNVGTIMGVLGALRIPHTLVTPQAWKKAAGLIGTDKDAALDGTQQEGQGPSTGRRCTDCEARIVMNYWPGTKIIKSRGNAFDWRNSTSKVTNTKEFKLSQHSTLANAGAGTDRKKSFTIYSKAKATK